jgi:hypothetical protein
VGRHGPSSSKSLFMTIQIAAEFCRLAQNKRTPLIAVSMLLSPRSICSSNSLFLKISTLMHGETVLLLPYKLLLSLIPVPQSNPTRSRPTSEAPVGLIFIHSLSC